MIFLHQQLKKTLRIINEQFYLCRIIKEIIDENYLRLTPSLGAVILD